MKKWTALLLLPLLTACSFVKYSFSGTSIQADVKTITIPYVEYKALRVNPSLSNDLTEALKDKFRKLTRLEQVEMNGDLELVCEVTGYDVKATAVTANEVAAQNRLTVTVKVEFSNKNTPRTMCPSPSRRTPTSMPPSRSTPWKPPSAKKSWRNFAKIFSMRP